MILEGSICKRAETATGIHGCAFGITMEMNGNKIGNGFLESWRKSIDKIMGRWNSKVVVRNTKARDCLSLDH